MGTHLPIWKPAGWVIVTHTHPDHVGLAGWICERWDAPLWMSMTDYFVARHWSQPDPADAGGATGEPAVRHFAAHGLQDPEALDQIRQRASYYPNLVGPVPASFRRLMHGDTLTIGGRPWQVIVGYGHAPEHVSLSCDALRVLISGDMVLPRISTNVSVFNFEPEADPLPLYLKSLDRYADLPQDTLVLPSHGKPFRGLHERIRQQHEHHAERLAEVVEVAPRPVGRDRTGIVPAPADLHHSRSPWARPLRTCTPCISMENSGAARATTASTASRQCKPAAGSAGLGMQAGGGGFSATLALGTSSLSASL